MESEAGAEEKEENQEALNLLLPRFRRFDQGAEDGAGGLVFIYGALGVPLHGEHEVIWGSSFQGFDDAVVGAAGGDPQAIANCAG